MTEQEENIDKLFSNTFESYKPEVPDMEWLSLEKAMRKQNFMQFGVSHFNIFYATIISVTIGVGLYFGISKRSNTIDSKLKNLPQQNTPKNNTNKIIEKSYFLKTDSLPQAKMNVIKEKHAKIANSVKDSIIKPDTTAILIPLKITSAKADSTSQVVQPVTPEKKKIMRSLSAGGILSV